MRKTLLLITIILINNTYSQKSQFELFPEGLNFIPLKADPTEAKFGLIFVPENNNMEIDIGNNVDVLNYDLSGTERLTTGIEFFAYALSRSYQGKRLQIDAIDGLFGGNISYSKKLDENLLSARFSITHNSAHLVDGHWDFGNNRWIDNYKPVPYAKDFTDLAVAYEYNFSFASIRNYIDLEYAFLVRPSDIKRFNFSLGIEIGLPNLLSSILDKDKVVFLAHNFTLSGTKTYDGNNNSMLGIKFGNWKEKGLSLFISYYEGYDIFHSYYKRKLKRFGAGFSIDFL